MPASDKPQKDSNGNVFGWDSVIHNAIYDAANQITSCKWSLRGSKPLPCGCTEQLVNIETAGIIFFDNGYREYDLADKSSCGNPFCAGCGQIYTGSPGSPTKYYAYLGRGNPYNQPVHTAPLVTQAVKQYLEAKWVPLLDNGCECGGHKLGYARGPLHSNWCKMYDATPPKRNESHEELVARVRAGKKGIPVGP